MHSKTVMPGLDPGIHGPRTGRHGNTGDGRDKPGHDDKRLLSSLLCVLESVLCAGADAGHRPVRLLGIFAAWRLRAYGLAVVALYLALVWYGYHGGFWPVNGKGVPTTTDFTSAWIAGRQALHGHAALLYDSAEFVRLQQALIGPRPVYFPNFPYPPTYLLILAPVAVLRYLAAFFTYELTTLLACIAVAYLIVRRHPAIALVLASPFTLWNFMAGQSGFLTAALIGAALLALERRPVLAGVFIGCLTYKPQFGILFPVALVAAGKWRTIFSAAGTAALLVGLSAAVFGADVWAAFPRELAAQGKFNLADPTNANWALNHTVYGLVRRLGAGAAPAGAAQAVTTLGLATLIWCVWRAGMIRYPLKAATLAAAALIATPYSLAYDMAAIAIPVSFLAKDQMSYGLVRGEQTMLLGLFAASFSVLPTVGRMPVGLAIVLGVLGLVLRRALRSRRSEDLNARG
jgi:arabinofuranan 3-O-arabinosyltransferase